jgi:hypothetical protein
MKPKIFYRRGKWLCAFAVNGKGSLLFVGSTPIEAYEKFKETFDRLI